MNPYASWLSVRDPMQVIAETPGVLRKLQEILPPEAAEQAPGPGKWSPREILCHMADTEIAFAFRIRQALAETNHVIQPFDQDLWAGNYRAYSVADAVSTFEALRGWNVALIRAVTPQALPKKLNHPERGDMTFQVLVETMAGHDLNHLHQLESLSARAART